MWWRKQACAKLKIEVGTSSTESVSNSDSDDNIMNDI